MFCCRRREIPPKISENIPVEKFKNETRELDLSEKNLSHRDIESIVSLLEENSTMKNLNLFDNNIGNNGARVLGKGLSINGALDVLKLNGNIPLSKFRDENVKKLDLYSKEYKDVDAIVIASFLYINSTLTELNLAVNYITDVGAEAIANGLNNNKILTSINLSNNDNISDVGACAFAKQLKSNNALKVLNIGDNVVGDEGATAIADALKSNTTLAELLLYMNSITDVGVQAIAESLTSNTSLTKLQLDENQISNAGAKALAAALEKNNSLQKLHVAKNNGIRMSGIQVLKDAKQKRPNMQVLKM